MSARYDEILAIITGLEADFTKFYDKGNKAAGTRIRKGMQDIKAKAQEIRVEIQEKKNAEG